MSIRLISYRDDDSGESASASKLINVFPNDEAIVGSDKGCDLILAGLPGIGFRLYKSDNRTYKLEVKDSNLDIGIDSIPVDANSQVIQNGSLITCAGYVIQFLVELERASHKRKSGWLAHLSVLLISIILIGELGLITVLPRQIKARELWGVELNRQRTLDSLDQLRRRCQDMAAEDKGLRYQETIGFIQGELQQLVVYTRTHADRLNLEQLQELDRDFHEYGLILEKLENDSLYPLPKTTDTEYYLKQILADQKIPGE